MAFIDSAYLNAAFGASKVAAACPSSSEITALISQADAIVDAALMVGGYTRRSTTSTPATTPDMIKMLSAARWLLLAYGRKDLELPPQYWQNVNILDQVRNGILEIDGEARSIARSTGGVLFSDSSSTSQDAKPRVFSRKNMGGY